MLSFEHNTQIFISWLHFYNHGSKSIRTSHPQNCTETNLDIEWQGVNNDGNFEQGPIAEKGTVFVEHNFCKSDQLVNDISYFAKTSMRLAWHALGSTEEDLKKCSNFSCYVFSAVYRWRFKLNNKKDSERRNRSVSKPRDI